MNRPITQKFWKIRNASSVLQKKLTENNDIHPITAQLLINRGINDVEDAKDFISADLARLHDPFILKDMDKAVARIKLAAIKKESVLIFGDYDVDGVASSALLHNALIKMGIKVFNHIPHRMHEGYGLNDQITDFINEKEISLLIAVDCGITAVSEVDALNKAGIDVIILDHHEPADEGIPDAFAVVDPKRRDCPYPFAHLAAVGLVAKLIQALFGEIPEEDLDLIALGTIADVVQLRGENRIFVKAGLNTISNTKNKGLSALIDVAKIRGKKFRPYFVGYILGPRLNASGRMSSAQKSLDLLLSKEHGEAYSIAQDLENINIERQKLQRVVVQEAVSLVEKQVNFKDHKVIVVGKEGWHKGVLGIVASQVSERYSRPTIVISIQDGVGTASARSIDGFHLNEALTHCPDILENYGGHKLAAGLTIREENISKFKDLINDFAKDIIQIRDLIPTLNIDHEVSLSSLSLDLVKEIDLLEPYGEGNPPPIFCSRQLTVKSKPVVLGKETLKFWVTDGQTSISAIGFGMGKYKEYIDLGQKVDLAYQITIDDWNKPPTLQLKLEDIKESQS